MKKIILIATLIGTLQAEALAKLGMKSSGSNNTAAPRAILLAAPTKKVATVKTTPKKEAATITTSASQKNEILKYADSGVGSPYVWGGSRWSTTNRKILGADCSGFAQKSWGYPSKLEIGQSIPDGKRLTTAEFIKAQDAGYPWTRMDNLSHSKSQAGDAMVYRAKKNGHIFLVSKTDNSGVVTVEARGKKYGIGYARKSYAYLKNKGYKTLRRNY